MMKQTITSLILRFGKTEIEITQHKRQFKRLKDFQNMGPKMRHLWTPAKDPPWLYELA